MPCLLCGVGGSAVRRWITTGCCVGRLAPPAMWDQAVRAAAREGHVECLEWLHAHACAHYQQMTMRFPQGAAEMAALGGHLECLEWLHKRGAHMDVWVASCAAEGGNLECLEWVLRTHASTGVPLRTTLPMIVAAGAGQVGALEWLHARGGVPDAWTVQKAAEGGRIECLEWLSAHGAPLTAPACCAAARGGHLACLEWLHARGVPCGPEACTSAACSGHLRCLAWLLARGVPWQADAAVFRGLPNDGEREALLRGLFTARLLRRSISSMCRAWKERREDAAARTIQRAWLARWYAPGGGGFDAAHRKFAAAATDDVTTAAAPTKEEERIADLP